MARQRLQRLAELLDRYPVFETVAFAGWTKDEIDRMFTWAVGEDWRRAYCVSVPERVMRRTGLAVPWDADPMDTLIAIREEYTQYQLDEAVRQAQRQ